jgi:hypothetical protein
LQQQCIFQTPQRHHIRRLLIGPRQTQFTALVVAVEVPVAVHITPVEVGAEVVDSLSLQIPLRCSPMQPLQYRLVQAEQKVVLLAGAVELAAILGGMEQTLREVP